MKLKKLLASILCVAMVLSTMSFAAFAEEQSYAAAIDTFESANFSDEEISLFSTRSVDLQEPKVVMDGDQYFTTIKDALWTLKSADTTVHKIKILDDIEIDVNYSTYNYPILINGFAVELDLNGKTITADWSKYTGSRVDNAIIGVANGGKIDIIDSVGGGKIVNNDDREDVENRIFWIMTSTADKSIVVNIKGGTYIQNDINTALLYVQGNKPSDNLAPLYVNIYDGHFETVDDDFFNAYDGFQHESYIYGGTFNKNPNDWEIKIHPDFAPIENANGEWGVVECVVELWRAKNEAARNVELVLEGKFATLQEAIEAIGDREGEFVIKVLKDIEENVTVTQYGNQKITIEGDETNKPVISGTVTVNGRSNPEENEALTLKNLAFNADAAINNAVVFIPSGNYRYAMNITVDGCDVVGTTDDAYNFVTLIRESTGGGKNFVVKNTTVTGIHSLMQAKNITGLEIDGCEIIDCSEGINLNNTPAATIKNTTADVSGYAVRIGQSKDAGTPLDYDMLVTLENNTFTSSSTESSLIVARGGAQTADFDIKSGTYTNTAGMDVLSLIEGSEAAISGGVYSSNVSAYLTEGLTISVNEHGNYAVVANDAGNSSAVTENVTVSLEPTENANKYDVVLKADADTEIHRFLSAELNITLTPDANDITPISIKNIVGNEEYGIEVIKPQYNANEIWGFHLGEATDITVKEFTGSELTIATIELTGYGEGYLTVAAHANNKVQAIQSKDNNNVKFYTVDAATLVLPKDVTPVNLEVPTKDLTIEITFVNPIEDNDVAYQDMTVTVEGKDIDTKTIELGVSGDVQLVKSADGKIVQYVITLDDELTENNSYNITVTGAGYRTAEYRVTMTEDKTVYFWNDASKTDKEIEIGVSAPVKATFLAGDIAEDNIIDKYDLAAVVSYFGKYNLTDSDTTYKYAKYDLNRDGNIDSEDIAYVLASFGY